MSSVSKSDGANVDPTGSGMASTAMMRGRFSRGISRTNFCTASPTAVVVSTTAGRAVGQDGVEALGVAGELRREERHRDVARLDRGEKARHVVEALRAQDRDAVATRGDLLEPGADGVGARADLVPGELFQVAVRVVAVFDVAVGQRVSEVGNVLLQQR